MRLYTTTGATRVDDPKHGPFLVGADGAFDFPDELSNRLHGVHVNKKRVWETDDERVRRVNEEQLKSVRDPAALYSAVKEMSETQRGLSLNQSVLLAAVVKALGLDVSGGTAEPAAVEPEPVEDEDDEDPAEEPAEQDPADEIEEPEIEPEIKSPAPVKVEAPAKPATVKSAPAPAAADPSAIASKPTRGGRKSAASSSAPSA
jgi:hypothetical protein